MKKPQPLRQHLLAAIPALASDPDKLLVFVDNGSLASTYRQDWPLSTAIPWSWCSPTSVAPRRR